MMTPLSSKLVADVYMIESIPCEFRLQRISDGLFFGGTVNGEVKFCERWQDVPYFGCGVDVNDGYTEESTVAWQWEWNQAECDETMEGLDQKDFRVHIVLGESGY